MTQAEAIRSLLASRPIQRVSALLEAGISRSSLNDAAARGDLVRLSHGVVGAPGMEMEGRVDDAVACLVTGGVICGRSAAARLGLSDDAPDQTELLVPSASPKAPTSFPVKLRRTSDPRALDLGVETEMVGGIPVRMTGRARTVVDQYRFGVTEQHVLQALHTYMGEGGTGNELQTLCSLLQPGLWRQRVARDVANVGVARDRAHSREEGDAPVGEQDDDHAGGPAFLRGGP